MSADVRLMPDKPEACTIQRRVLRFIESKRVQTFLTILLLFDVIIVIAGVALDAEYPSCAAALRTCGLDEKHHCVEVPPSVEKLGFALTWTSNGILLIFVIEIVLTAFGAGVKDYLSTPTYVFDALVVFASLAVELAEGSQHHDTGLLVLARAWRFVTLLHGMNHLHESGRHGISSIEDDVHYDPLST
jgi:hypothetical protein